MDHLYVKEGYRRLGVGRAFMKHVSQDALRRGVEKVCWSTADWNTNAIGFYKQHGGEVWNGWSTFQLSKDAMVSLVESTT